MTSKEAQELLRAVRDTSEESRQVREAANRMMAEALERRKAAVLAALDAGLPRESIAQEAGVNRNLLYRIAGKSSR